MHDSRWATRSRSESDLTASGSRETLKASGGPGLGKGELIIPIKGITIGKETLTDSLIAL